MKNIPTFSIVYIVSSLTITLLIFSQSVNPYHYAYTFQSTFLSFNLCKPLIAIFYLNRVSALLPIQLIFAYLATSKIGSKIYGRHTNAEIAWLFSFSIICLTLYSTFVVDLYFYGSSFIMVMLMVWAIQFPKDNFIFFKRLKINSIYFPIIYLAIMIFFGSCYKYYLAGLPIGLIYGILRNPPFIHSFGDLLPIPKILKKFFREDFYLMDEQKMEIILRGQPSNTSLGEKINVN